MDFPALKQCGLETLLSDFGQEIFTPQGIFYWSGRAKQEADINGTLGAGVGQLPWMEKSGTCYIPCMLDFYEGLTAEEVFPYAPICGVPTFRKAWRDWILYKSGQRAETIEPYLTQPVVVPGVTAGIHVMSRLLLNPGEQLIVSAKHWENYDLMLKCLGISLLTHNTFTPDNDFDIEDMVKAIETTWKTCNRAVVLLNFPHNPTGYVPTPELIQKLRQALVATLNSHPDKWLALLFDDAYEGYTYVPEVIEQSAFYDFVNLHSRLLPVKMDGSSKEMLWYGGRIAGVTFGLHSAWTAQVSLEDLNKELDSKLGGIIRGTLSNSPRAVQSILTKALDQKERLLDQRAETIRMLCERATVLRRMLDQCNNPRISADPFQGGFFAFLNIEGMPAREVAEQTITKHRVAVVPSSNPDLKINGVRVAFCGIEADDLPKVVDALVDVVG